MAGGLALFLPNKQRVGAHPFDCAQGRRSCVRERVGAKPTTGYPRMAIETKTEGHASDTATHDLSGRLTRRRRSPQEAFRTASKASQGCHRRERGRGLARSSRPSYLWELGAHLIERLNRRWKYLLLLSVLPIVFGVLTREGASTRKS